MDQQDNNDKHHFDQISPELKAFEARLAEKTPAGQIASESIWFEAGRKTEARRTRKLHATYGGFMVLLLSLNATMMLTMMTMTTNGFDSTDGSPHTGAGTVATQNQNNDAQDQKHEARIKVAPDRAVTKPDFKMNVSTPAVSENKAITRLMTETKTKGGYHYLRDAVVTNDISTLPDYRSSRMLVANHQTDKSARVKPVHKVVNMVDLLIKAQKRRKGKS